MNLLSIFAASFLVVCISSCLTFPAAAAAEATKVPQIIVRCDDIGMNHSVNLGLQKMLESGIPFSASVMFVTPYYQEAVGLLKSHPEVTVGVHLVVNNEWKTFRWGPVAGAEAVPSLVGKDGYFYGTEAELNERHPTLSDIATEVRAQLQRARASGLRIEYVDFHMGTLIFNWNYLKVVLDLAKEYHLEVAHIHRERYHDGIYFSAPETKTRDLASMVRSLPTPSEPWLFVFHIAVNSPEMEILEDFNPNGPKHLGQQREGDLKALLSAEFATAVREKGLRLITYREFFEELKQP